MKLRPLPFVTELEQLSATDPGAALERRNNAMHELLRTPGFQLVLSALQYEQHEAVTALRHGDPNPAFHSGRARAIDTVITRLTALFPDGAAPDLEPEEELALPLYGDPSPFDIPYPLSGE